MALACGTCQCLADSVLFSSSTASRGRGLVRQPGSYQDGGMIKTAALLPADLNRLTRETDMLLATVDSLTDEEFAAPSKCEGWTRAHVVAHLALGADAMGNMITWGTTGVETPPYVSWDARNADIENLAKKSPADIKAALRTAIKNFADKAATLKDGLKAETVKTAGGAGVTPYAVPALRISEVIIHHADLDTVWGLGEADMDALEDTLEIVVERVSAKEDFPGVTVDTDEGEHYVHRRRRHGNQGWPRCGHRVAGSGADRRPPVRRRAARAPGPVYRLSSGGPFPRRLRIRVFEMSIPTGRRAQRSARR